MESNRGGRPDKKGLSTTTRLSQELDSKASLKLKEGDFKITFLDDYIPHQLDTPENPDTPSEESEFVLIQIDEAPPPVKRSVLALDLAESKFTEIMPAPIPIKHRPANIYKKITENISASFHAVYKVRKISPKNISHIYFFKQNKFNYLDSFMYELEETCNAFYRLIAPHHCSTSRAVYNKTNQNVAIISKEFPGFKSTREDPLQEEDLTINALAYMSIEQLEALDERMRKQNYPLEKNDDSHIVWEGMVENRSGRDYIKYQVTAKDLKNYRTVKGLAIGLTTSYLFEEDDLHTGNMSKDGKRIDFDMSLWPILFDFKETGPIDGTFRNPYDRFKIAAEDIINFPNLTVADPFYWPTKPAPYIPESVLTALSLITNVTQNPFKSKDNLIYQKLATHPVFIYHKFVTLLKFILTDIQMYQNLMPLHMRDELFLYNKSKNISTTIADHLKNRINVFKEELLKIPHFKQFLKDNGDKAFKHILTEFSEQNTKYAKKAENKPLHKLQLINLEKIMNEYVDICDQSGIEKKADTLIKDRDIARMVVNNSEDKKTCSFK